MALEPLIFDRLNDASITAIVGPRIHATEPPENADWPFIVFTVDASDPVTAMSGVTALARYGVQIDVWARSITQRTALADAIRARLSGYRGGAIQASIYRSEQPEALRTGNVGDVYHSALTFAVWAAA